MSIKVSAHTMIIGPEIITTDIKHLSINFQELLLPYFPYTLTFAYSAVSLNKGGNEYGIW